MSLSREQHNEIMRIIDERRYAALRDQSRREEMLYEALPALRVLSDRISSLSALEASQRIGKDPAGADDTRKKREDAVKAKHTLLHDAGYPEDYLEVSYSCQRCRDTGYDGRTKCGCFRQLESELLNRQSGLPALMARENFSTLDTGIYDRSVPIEELKPKYITQYDYMTRKGGIIDIVMDYAGDFGSGEGKHSILMFGAPGTGKTFLCNCIARAVIERQHTVSYVRAGDMFAALSKSAFQRGAVQVSESQGQRYEECELLIIDDLGTEFATEFTRARLFSIISNRLSNGKSTIISTNLSMNQLCSNYGERISSRFMGEYILLPFYGSDLRMA